MNIGVARLNKKATEFILDDIKKNGVISLGIDESMTAILFRIDDESETKKSLLEKLPSVDEIHFIEGREKEKLIKQYTGYGQVCVSV